MNTKETAPASAPKRPTTNPDGYQRTSDDHPREIAEDYVELIDDLIGEPGEAHAVDAARGLGVAHVPVTATLPPPNYACHDSHPPPRPSFPAH